MGATGIYILINCKRLQHIVKDGRVNQEDLGPTWRSDLTDWRKIETVSRLILWRGTRERERRKYTYRLELMFIRYLKINY